MRHKSTFKQKLLYILVFLFLAIASFFVFISVDYSNDKALQITNYAKSGNYREAVKIYLELSPKEIRSKKGINAFYALFQAVDYALHHNKTYVKKELDFLLKVVDTVLIPNARKTSSLIGETKQIRIKIIAEIKRIKP